jgi:fructosamine-3-kinase
MQVYHKTNSRVDKAFFEAESMGLRWLSDAGSGDVAGVAGAAGAGGAVRPVRVAQVVEYGATYLDVEFIQPTSPTAEAAVSFGRSLAVMHDAGAPYYGYSPSPCAYFGPLSDPVPAVNGEYSDYWDYLIAGRMVPMLEEGVRRGEFSQADLAETIEVLERLRDSGVGVSSGELCGAGMSGAGMSGAGAGVPEASSWASDQPARVHGDLWSGNLLWTPAASQQPLAQAREEAGGGGTQLALSAHEAGGGVAPAGTGDSGALADALAREEAGVEAVLIDPSAHGGHREEDLAMLQLFGCPYFDQILDGYNSVHPLAKGYRARFTLHNLYPIAGHVVFFGGSYRMQYHQMLRAVKKLGKL